jgi:hypothetical protein
MAFRYKCDLYVLRWMPGVVKGEYVNFAVMLRDQGSGETVVRFQHDHRRLRCLDRDFDAELFAELESEIKRRVSDPADCAKFFEKVPDWASSALQLSAAAGVLTNDIQSELKLLTQLYLKPKPRAKEAGVVRLRGIHGRVHDAFAESDISKAFRWNIRVDQFVPGDPLVIDCGYESHGIFKMFHGVALKKSTNAAKNLAFSYPWFRDAFAAQERLTPQLIAVLDDHGAPPAHVDFAARAFAGSAIQPISISALDQQVELARADLMQ